MIGQTGKLLSGAEIVALLSGRDLVQNKITASSSAGLLIEAANGTDVGLLGVGNTANITWYGNANWNGTSYVFATDPGGTETLRVGGASFVNGYLKVVGDQSGGDIKALSGNSTLRVTPGSVATDPAIQLFGSGAGTTPGADRNVAYITSDYITFFKSDSASSGVILRPNLPTSSAGLPTGALWNDGGTVRVA